jgi:hypothetical protein
MAIAKATRDLLLVEARHRCTICSEKCFEIHHIVEQADGGNDEADNLIVLCPNCHQHRYHRSGEFTRDQLRLYKAKLKEQNEIERRLLLNLEEIRTEVGKVPPNDSEERLQRELAEATALVSPSRSPRIVEAVSVMSRWLAERDLLRGGARRAIEVEWEVERQRQRSWYAPHNITRVDDDAWSKAPDFPAAYTFVLLLDRKPHQTWAEAFKAVYSQSGYSMKRKAKLVHDRIVMIVADSDNLQWHADFAKQVVAETNAAIETRYFPEVDKRIDASLRHELQQFDTIQSLKARVKDIKL